MRRSGVFELAQFQERGDALPASDERRVRSRRGPRAPLSDRVGPRTLSRLRRASHCNEAGPARLRIPLPPRLLRMGELGVFGTASHAEGWWRRVEAEVQKLVDRHLPRGATLLGLSLDEETLEVLATFSLESPGRSPVD